MHQSQGNGEGLTPAQQDYFDIVERLDGEGRLGRVIEVSKEDLKHVDSNGKLVKGFTRVIGFKPNPQ